MVESIENACLSAIVYYGSISPGNIILVGGTLSVPEISGYNKRLRSREGGAAFVVNDEGLEALVSNKPFREQTIIDKSSYLTQHNWKNDVFFHGSFRGREIPQEAFSEYVCRETGTGPVFTLSNELNLVLKIQKDLNGRSSISSKNALDAASAIVGMAKSGRKFDYEAFADYLLERNTASDVLIYLKRSMPLLTKMANNNLPREDRYVYLNAIAQTMDYVAERKYPSRSGISRLLLWTDR